MKHLFWAMALLLCVGCGGSNSNSEPKEETPEQSKVDEFSIAVVGFSANAGASQSEIEGISAIFTTYFRPAGYTLVERLRVDKIIEEHNMQQGKLTQNDMVRLGELLNVQKIVVGDIMVIEGEYNVDVRVVDVERGIIAVSDGAVFNVGSSYRNLMQSLATRLSNAISIGEGDEPKEPVAPPVKEPEVRVVFDYLKVFPNDIGEYDAEPTTIIAQLNKQEKYGYNTWRIPTREELSLLKANGFPVSNSYMTKENPRGIVLLVTDKGDAATVNQERAEEKRKQEEEKRKQEEEKKEKARIEKSIKDGLGRDGIYQVGDYYNRNGNKGVVFKIWDGGRNGKILSLDETACKWKDAEQWCRNHGDGWYLPTKDDLLAIYRNQQDVNEGLNKYKGGKLKNDDYWSSTEYKDDAWYVRMSDGYTSRDYNNKYDYTKYYVRAVSAF